MTDKLNKISPIFITEVPLLLEIWSRLFDAASFYQSQVISPKNTPLNFSLKKKPSGHYVLSDESRDIRINSSAELFDFSDLIQYS